MKIIICDDKIEEILEIKSLCSGSPCEAGTCGRDWGDHQSRRA